MCACHATIRHGSSLDIRPAGTARRDRRISPGVAWDQLLAIAGIRDIGISPHHRADWSGLVEDGRSRLAREPRISADAGTVGAYAYRRSLGAGGSGRHGHLRWNEAGATGARGRGHACASEPAVRVIILAPPPGAVGLGGAKQGMGH